MSVAGIQATVAHRASPACGLTSAWSRANCSSDGSNSGGSPALLWAAMHAAISDAVNTANLEAIMMLAPL
jgi:hypothetical protein